MYGPLFIVHDMGMPFIVGVIMLPILPIIPYWIASHTAVKERNIMNKQ